MVLCNAKLFLECKVILSPIVRKSIIELREALCQISDIRQQMARATVFRGYRSVTVCCSGLLGVMAAACQPFVVTSPVSQLDRYLSLWIGIAAVSVLVVAVEMWWRARVNRSAMTWQMTQLAVEQFMPCVVVGALLTLCIYHAAPQVAWMLPGLWALVFGLGVFASYRLLPRQLLWAGVFYVLCGVICLLHGQGPNALSPWLMGISFGGGQLISAAILYWTLERPDASQE